MTPFARHSMIWPMDAAEATYSSFAPTVAIQHQGRQQYDYFGVNSAASSIQVVPLSYTTSEVAAVDLVEDGRGVGALRSMF